jgi:hypothetical protein
MWEGNALSLPQPSLLPAETPEHFPTKRQDTG